MDVIGIIPARYASSRFEGKILANILGKPLIQHVWENAKKSKLLDDLIVACDDERIKKVVEDFGGKAIITSRDHDSGTDRLTEIVQPLDVKIVINIQGDEPLIDPTIINHLTSALLDDSDCVMATVIKRIDNKEEIKDPNVVKVVIDRDDFVLYFSRAAIPYAGKTTKEDFYYKHIGLYGYTKDFLFTFKNLPESHLEKIERLEQLRVLEGGFKIKAIHTDLETIGVDTPEDIEKVEEIMRQRK